MLQPYERDLKILEILDEYQTLARSDLENAVFKGAEVSASSRAKLLLRSLGRLQKELGTYRAKPKEVIFYRKGFGKTRSIEHEALLSSLRFRAMADSATVKFYLDFDFGYGFVETEGLVDGYLRNFHKPDGLWIRQIEGEMKLLTFEYERTLRNQQRIQERISALCSPHYWGGESIILCETPVIRRAFDSALVILRNKLPNARFDRLSFVNLHELRSGGPKTYNEMSSLIFNTLRIA